MSLALLLCFAVSMLWWLILSYSGGQGRLNGVLSQSTGHLLELGIFRDHPRVLLATLRDLCWVSWSLTKVLFLPVIVVTVPMLISVVVLAHCLGSRPVDVGERVVLQIQSSQEPQLQLSDGLVLDSEIIKMATQDRWVCRLVGETHGQHSISFSEGGAVRHRSLFVGVDPSWGRAREAFTGLSLEVLYPNRNIWLGSRRFHWGIPVLLLFTLCLGATKRLQKP